ncbi:hypothetical protein POK33_36450 [Burkholderia cenocepacia]|uniref:hypothetical protein n=1 Tax=Burkholderia cenocepacia TaxID=95486 RepID=UPI0023B8C1FD|nr:hypothetical protein [Burkholderia cenocepacia]MDF0506245.1 hypothetical protein [Burkholderia cenocepacia]
MASTGTAIRIRIVFGECAEIGQCGFKSTFGHGRQAPRIDERRRERLNRFVTRQQFIAEVKLAGVECSRRGIGKQAEITRILIQKTQETIETCLKRLRRLQIDGHKSGILWYG